MPVAVAALRPQNAKRRIVSRRLRRGALDVTSASVISLSMKDGTTSLYTAQRQTCVDESAGDAD
jgi:hypothetical protein